MADWFTFWVIQVWGNEWLSLVGTGAIFALIGLIGRMSWILLISLLMIYFITFTIAFSGLFVYLLLTILAMIYFIVNAVRFFGGDTT